MFARVCGVVAFVLLGVLILGLVIKGMMGGPPGPGVTQLGFEEFKQKIGATGRMPMTLSLKTMYERVGEPMKQEMAGKNVYFYYRVREGGVRIIGEKMHYEKEQMVLDIQSVSLY